MTREPEWDDHERAKLLAWETYQAEICDCGLHRDIADTNPDLTMPERYCPVCAAIERNKRIYAERDEAAMKVHGPNPPASLPRPDDGRYLSLAPKPPKDVTDGP